MAAYRCKPAAVKALGPNLDTGGLAFGPLDVFLEVLLGYPSDDARGHQDNHCNYYQ
jgi:hypothetical protein